MRPADATPIATGTTFLADNDLVRGFKVHVSVADFTTTPWVAQTIDIEPPSTTAGSQRPMSVSPARGCSEPRPMIIRDIDHLDSAVANGDDPMSGDPITDSIGTSPPHDCDQRHNAVAGFMPPPTAAGFGGTVGAVPSRGEL